MHRIPRTNYDGAPALRVLLVLIASIYLACPTGNYYRRGILARIKRSGFQEQIRQTQIERQRRESNRTTLVL